MSSEERYRFLLENTSDMVFHVRLREPLPLRLAPHEQVDWIYREAFFVAVGDGFARWHGYDRAKDLAGQPLGDVLPRTADNEAMMLRLVASDHRLAQARTEHLDRAGHRKLMLVSIAGRIEDGCVREYDAAARDVSERATVADALQEQQRLLASVTDNASLALFLMDARQECVFMNPAAEQMTGFTIDELRGRPLHDAIHHTRPDGSPVPLAECPIDRAFPSNDRERGEDVFVHKDGRFYDVAFTASPIRDADGKPVGTVIEVQDIGERKRAEAAMHASEARFRNIFDHAATGIAFTDWTGRFLECNAAFSAIVGYTEKELREIAFADLVHPDDRAENLAAVRRLMDEELPFFEIENRYVRRDGAPVWVQKFVSLLRDESGAPAHLVALVTDVTDRRRAQLALAFLSDLGTALAPLSSPLEIAEAAARLVARHFDVAHASFHGAGADGAALAVLGGAEAVGDDGRLAERLGDAFLAQLRAGGVVAVRDDEVVLLQEVAARVHLRLERARAEAALRDRERRLRGIFDSAFHYIALLAPDGTVLEANRSALAGMGTSAGDVVGTRLWEAVWFSQRPDERDRVREAIRRARAGELLRFELDYRRGDGSDGTVDFSLSPVRDERGEIVLLVAEGHDVTDRKRAEAALRLADRRKDEFLAMLGHELRNPLAPIRNAVEIIRLVGPKEPTLDGARDMIERQVEHMARLVDDLLDVARVSRSMIQLQKGPLELATAVRHAVETSRPFVEARGHRLDVVLPREPLPVDGDFARLVQVVGNLLHNAAKYTDRGGRIRISLERAGDGGAAEAVLRVRDSGQGIDPAALGSVFDLFFQVDHQLDRADGGLGIGLSLVKSLVAMHGGRVEAHSEGRGRGSEFVVRLPCLPDEPQTQAAPKATAPPKTARPLRVLVVDDLRDSAESMALLLEMDGHAVSIAHDGDEAVARACAERPDVVLLDIGLPKRSGYDACRAMREDGLADALIVAMTGYGQDADRRTSEAAGFDTHLVKPVDLPTLRELLARRARLG
ncbi:MAG: hypothetical protein DCC71_00865 [Proteobacteria bacterium]|nr:MAG: hypothetical protein DCC71_00865 [Pseudomonadota bacterium]